MNIPTPNLRYPDVAGEPMKHRQPQRHGTPGQGYGHPRSGTMRRGENHLHRGHERRHRRKPWYLPSWLWEQQLAQMEAEQQMALQMGGLSMGGGGMSSMGMGDTSSDYAQNGTDDSGLELPPDASADWQNQLNPSPDLNDQGHDKKHKHKKHKKSGDDAMSGRGYGMQDEGIKGQDSSGDSSVQAQPQSGGYSGGFSDQSPVSQGNLKKSMQRNTYKPPNRMDIGALQSSDNEISDDMENIGPYDNMSQGYETESTEQSTPYSTQTDSTYTNLSDPNYQPNPWGYGSG